MVDISLILKKARVEVKMSTLGNQESDFFCSLVGKSWPTSLIESLLKRGRIQIYRATGFE